MVSETLDGAEAAYFVVTGVCSPDMGVASPNPTSTRVKYAARLFRDATYADISVEMYAVGPEGPRKYAREILQKIGALNYASIR